MLKSSISISDLPLSDRLCVLFNYFPDGSYNPDMPKMDLFFYRHRKDLGAGLSFNLSQPPYSPDLRKAYENLHASRILEYSNPRLRFTINREVCSKVINEFIRRDGNEEKMLDEDDILEFKVLAGELAHILQT